MVNYTYNGWSYIDPKTIGGLNLFAYCNNNPVMYSDPSGHVWYNPATWDWKTIADVGITVVSGMVAIGKGIKSGIKTYIKTSAAVNSITGIPFLGNLLGSIAGFESFAFTVVTTFGTINNAVYYNHISDGQSSVIEPFSATEPSFYVNNGYINRWERLDYTKSVMVKARLSNKYNLNAWRYQSEYSAHIYAWLISSWAYKNDNFGIFAQMASAAYNTGILVNASDENLITKVLTIMFGIFGL